MYICIYVYVYALFTTIHAGSRVTAGQFTTVENDVSIYVFIYLFNMYTLIDRYVYIHICICALYYGLRGLARHRRTVHHCRKRREHLLIYTYIHT